MTSITIITIVVVALLTLLIFTLTWLSYSSCIKLFKLEVTGGKYDLELLDKQKKKKRKREIIGMIGSYLLITLLLSLFVSGLVYKIKGDNFTINNHTALVIKTGSMSDFYDEDIASKYNYDTTLHFSAGDICIFEKIDINDELVINDVYGYLSKGDIITHRLIDEKESGYVFMGDNNPISDYDFSKRLVKRENIVYHYTGNKIPEIGAFILYAQSYFGIWSLAGMVGVIISSEITCYKLNKILKQRREELGGATDDEK